MKNPAKIQVGSRVAYTRDALKTFGSAYADRRGIVLKLEEKSPGWILATVEWEGTGARCSDVNVRNLCTTKSLAFVE